MLVLELQNEHDKAIRAHGCSEFPHECCGFLLGHDTHAVRQIQSVQPATNDREQSVQHNRFVINPEVFMKVDRAARRQGWDLLGVYHSHPNASARPSQYDLEHAWPVYSYLIVSVRDGCCDQMTSWVLRPERDGFDEQIVNISRSMET